jgi:O-antigen ligase
MLANSLEKRKISFMAIAMYSVLIAPISVSMFGDGVSANYLFALLLLGPLKYVNNNDASVYLCYCIISFVLGIFFLSDGSADFLLRQFISFGLFVAGLMILFVKLPGQLDDFLHAVVLASVLYSFYALFTVMANNFSLLDMYMIKGGLRDYITDWPQRYVIVLIFGFFIALSNASVKKVWLIPALIILSCIFLTYTRAAWLAVVVGLVYHLVGFVTRGGWVAKVKIFSAFICIGAVTLFFLRNNIIALQVGEAISVLGIDIISVLISAGESESIGSTSERLGLWTLMLEIISVNPITGSGFAGVYLFADGQGSSHNQILDIFFRTGVIGLIFYSWFWWKLLAFYKKYNRGIFSGLIAIFVFGIFHETTKLSYGAVVFFVLLNKMYEYKRLHAGHLES